jgi:hypothetical protein
LFWDIGDIDPSSKILKKYGGESSDRLGIKVQIRALYQAKKDL